MKHGERWFRSDKLDEFSAKFAKGYNPFENVHLGRDIVIEYEREMVVDLMCEYDMFWFPFDSQTCGVELYQREEEITLIPESVAYTGPRQLIQYTVVGIDMCPAVFEVNIWIFLGKIHISQDRLGLLVVFQLSRPLMSSMLTTFLPTTILVVITYLANAFALNYLAVVIQVNLTVLLVLATL